MSGHTAATFLSSRNFPVVSNWLTIVVMESSIVSLNFNRNLVLQGSMIQIVRFIFLIMLSISSLPKGRTGSQWFLSISCGMTFVYSGHETVPWFFLFYLGRNLQICLVVWMEIQWVALDFHPLALVMIWIFWRGFWSYFYYHLICSIYVFSWSNVGTSYILSWYAYILGGSHVV